MTWLIILIIGVAWLGLGRVIVGSLQVVAAILILLFIMAVVSHQPTIKQNARGTTQPQLPPR